MSSLHEFEMIQRIQRTLSSLSKLDWLVGIGDDAAVRKISAHHFELITQDILLEKIHFIAKTAKDFVKLGWKALAVNLSDIAAMGGLPIGAVIGLGIPSSANIRDVDSLYQGLKECAEKYHCPIVGGDTNRSKSGWVIAVTVVGECKSFPILRKGAKIGDSLWVTGTLGDAALGWKLKQQRILNKEGEHFLRRLERPVPRLDWGGEFLRSKMVTGMIDLSDGLAGDVRHLMEASGVGFEIELEKIPRDPRFSLVCNKHRFSPYSLLLEGGEDYELLFTVRKGEEMRFENLLQKKSIEATCIGRVTKNRKLVFLENAKKIKKSFVGFQHF